MKSMRLFCASARSFSTEPFKLMKLPWDKNALKPYMSAETVDFHYGKHHATYVNNLNAIAKTDSKIANSDLISLVKTLDSGKPFNQAAQIYNHDFFWNCIKPNAGGEPTGELLAAINESFGSFEKFKELFTAEAVNHFGSGWAWLIKSPDGKLKIISTHDAECPISKRNNKGVPLLTCDVWEHSYYIDYRNARPAFLKSFWSIVNWDFVKQQFTSA
eukprot:TRINITY_DN282_c0_g1_i1.p1 TRINITY_DN282_c0_g1~~TRINITY_DN282_c0_g1_i1.p1  ORF type:complete len:216 (+),score=30.66 TRINITY_DN282_c0_g1_i1:41-688(+)